MFFTLLRNRLRWQSTAYSPLFPLEQAFHTSLAGHALGHIMILSKTSWKETLGCCLYKTKFQALFSSWPAAFLLSLKLIAVETQLPCWSQCWTPCSVKEADLDSCDSGLRPLHHSSHIQLYLTSYLVSFILEIDIFSFPGVTRLLCTKIFPYCKLSISAS